MGDAVGKVIVRITELEAEELKKNNAFKQGESIRMFRTCPRVLGGFVLKKDNAGHYLEFSFEK
ncbi:MAG: hypothetical protein PHN39_02160 [Candidatus Pacebacteria bacterium]|nr:hypothetical protein [Candidatus Paceibacterota bacterium]